MADNKFKATNSRRYKRLNADYLLKYEPGQRGDQSRITNIKNLSAGGAKFITKDLLEESSTIRVSVLVPPLEQSFQANAKILRVRRLKSKFIYTVAVQFTDIKPEEQSILNTFIEDLSGDPTAGFSIDHANVVIRHGDPIGSTE